MRLASDLDQLQAEQPGPGQDPNQRGLVGQPATQDRPHRLDGHIQLVGQRGHDRIGGSTPHPHRIADRSHAQHPRALVLPPVHQDITIVPDERVVILCSG